MLTDHSKKITTDWLIRMNRDISRNACNRFVNRRVLEAHACVFMLIEDTLSCISSLRSLQRYTVDQIICAVYLLKMLQSFKGIFVLLGRSSDQLPSIRWNATA